MRTLTFYGYSDDLIYMKGGNPDEPCEISCGRDENAVFQVAVPNGDGLFVVVQRLGRISGTWSVGIAPLDGESALPGWQTRWSFGGIDYDNRLELAMQGFVTTPAPRYSACLEIDAPDDAVASLERPPDGARP